VVQAACRTQGLVFAEVFNGDVGEVVAAILSEVTKDRLVVIANQEDLLDLGYLGYRAEAVLDYGVSGDIKEGL
jgi:hypothetical protein